MSKGEPEEPKENPYKDIMERVDGILESYKLDRQKVKEKVETMLDEMGVPFIRVEVEEDRNREDNQQVCNVMIFVPRSWPDRPKEEGEGEYLISCNLPERPYEPEGHD